MLIENNNSFLNELTRLFSSSRENGSSLYLTMKRLSQKPQPKTNSYTVKRQKETAKAQSKLKQSESKMEVDEESDQSPKCLVRAQCGKRKISTIIEAKDVEQFKALYSSVLRGNIIGLKKRDKKKTYKKGSVATQVKPTTQ